MTKPTIRKAAPRAGDSFEEKLARLLDTPHLARVVPLLAPETLHRLVRHRGIDACGELVAAATPAQLTALFDLDLWHGAEPGADEQLDVERFGEWLEVLVELGEAVAARTVAALDESLVIAGLCRYVRVFDLGTFEPIAQSDDEATVRGELMNSERGTDGPEFEVGGYLIRGRRSDTWDAILALLIALDATHPRTFHALMHGCRRLSDSRAEIDGLDDLLIAPEQHLFDVADEREQRRSRLGYATPADARAFLALARQPHEGVNPVAAAYFRAIDEEGDAQRAARASAPEHDRSVDSAGVRDIRREGSAPDDGSEASIDAVVDLLAEAGLAPERPRALLEAADRGPGTTRLSLLRRCMEFVLRHDQAVYVRRSRELAFLANVLGAACSVHSRPFTPQEASDAAASVCNLGLETWSAPRMSTDRDARPGDGAPPDAFLMDHDLVAAFEEGWSVLYRDVSLFVADQLLSTLHGLRGGDAEIDERLRGLERELVSQRAAGAPWRARESADVLALLDRAAWRSVVGLMAECPIVSGALIAGLTGRAKTAPLAAFEFIATSEQIRDVHAYMRVLRGLLAR